MAQFLPTTEDTVQASGGLVQTRSLRVVERPSPRFVSWPAGLRNGQCVAGVGGSRRSTKSDPQRRAVALEGCGALWSYLRRRKNLVCPQIDHAFHRRPCALFYRAVIC